MSILACRKELEISVPFDTFDHVLGREFYHKLNRIVVCDNLFFMHAKILRQNMQQGVLGLLKVNVELLLLVLGEMIKIKESVPGQTPPMFGRVQNLGGLIGQEGIGRPKSVPQISEIGCDSLGCGVTNM